ncbi:hypothetical protein JXA05_01710, partial [Candidatus Peregrinibacteria bacterium]|nr:hypothetical protein [Candidatus Peregrinibacteria bacterium]
LWRGGWESLGNIPRMAEADMSAARQLAKTTPEDIRQGHNPDLEQKFRTKMEELGIPLDA